MGVKAAEFEIAKNDGVQSYGNIVSLVESPKQAGVIYAGTDDGKVHMTKDGGKTWTDITSKFPGVPKNSYVSRLVPSAHDVNVVYASFDNHRADDMNTYVYASVDGGNNFRSIGEGIPKGHTVTSMTEDPKNPNVLYSGTEFGLFVSPDRGGKWTRVKGNLPTVPIHEIVFHPRDNDMILATHGRSIWILDDATPLQQYPEAIKSDAFLFDMRPAMQFNPANNRGFVTDKPFFGKNPTYGAPISFYLAKAQTNVALRIRDAAGNAGARDHRQRPARCARRRRQSRLLGSASPAAGAAGGSAGRRRWWWWRIWRRRQQRPERAARRVSRHARRRRQGCGDEDRSRHRRQGRADDRRRSQDVARHGAQPARHAARGECRGRSGQRRWRRS